MRSIYPSYNIHVLYYTMIECIYIYIERYANVLSYMKIFTKELSSWVFYGSRVDSNLHIYIYIYIRMQDAMVLCHSIDEDSVQPLDDTPLYPPGVIYLIEQQDSYNNCHKNNCETNVDKANHIVGAISGSIYGSRLATDKYAWDVVCIHMYNIPRVYDQCTHIKKISMAGRLMSYRR